jgi:hypothetical protein
VEENNDDSISSHNASFVALVDLILGVDNGCLSVDILNYTKVFDDTSDKSR